MDLILGRFADSEIAALTDAELTELEQLIEVPDPDLYAALTSEDAPAEDIGGPMFARIRAFKIADRAS